MTAPKRERETSQELVFEDDCDCVDGYSTPMGPQYWTSVGQHDAHRQNCSNSFSSSKDSFQDHKLSSQLNSTTSVDPLLKSSAEDFDLRVEAVNGTNEEEFINGCCPFCHCFVMADSSLTKVTQLSHRLRMSKSPLLKFMPDLGVYSQLAGKGLLDSDDRNFDCPTMGMHASQTDISTIINEHVLRRKIDVCPLCASKMDTANDVIVDHDLNAGCGIVDTSRQVEDLDVFTSSYAPIEQSMYCDGVQEERRLRTKDSFSLQHGSLAEKSEVYEEKALEAYQEEDRIGPSQMTRTSLIHSEEKGFDKAIERLEQRNYANSGLYQCLNDVVDADFGDSESIQDFQKTGNNFRKQKTQASGKNCCKNKVVNHDNDERKLQNKSDCRNEILDGRTTGSVCEDVKSKSKAVAVKRRKRKKNKSKKTMPAARVNPEPQHIIEISGNKGRDPNVDEIEGKRAFDRKEEADLNQESDENYDGQSAHEIERIGFSQGEKFSEQPNGGIDSSGEVKVRQHFADLECAIVENRCRNFDRSVQTASNHVDREIEDITKDSREIQDDVTLINQLKEVREEVMQSRLKDTIVERETDVEETLDVNEVGLDAKCGGMIVNEDNNRNSELGSFIGSAVTDISTEAAFPGNVELENFNVSQTECQNEGVIEQDLMPKKIGYAQYNQTLNAQDGFKSEEALKNCNGSLSEKRNVEVETNSDEMASTEDSNIDVVLPLFTVDGICDLHCVTLRQKDFDFDLSLSGNETAVDGGQDVVSRCGTSVWTRNKLGLKIDHDSESVLDMVENPSDSPIRIGELPECNGVPEKFLVPPVCIASRNITTPKEDLGFAKVPGYLPQLKSMEEEDDEESSSVPQLESDTPKDDPIAAGHCDANRFIADALSNSLPAETVVCPGPDEVESAQPGTGARPKELSFSSAQSDPLPLSSPRPSTLSKSARPNSLIGLSKPDVNLPRLKLDFSACESTTDNEKSLSCSFIPFPGGAASSQRKRFNFSSVENFISAEFDDSAPLRKILTTKAESNSGKCCDSANFLSSDDRGSADDVKAKSALSSFPPPFPSATAAKRPTSWSQSLPNPNRAVLPKRPNSLNITVSNSIPVKVLPLQGLELPTENLPCQEASLENKTRPSLIKDLVQDSVTIPNNVESPFTSKLDDYCPVPSSDTPATAAPPISSNINLRITDLGKVAPVWVPDGEAPRCMQCDSRFTFTRRRHHCRTCGKVFCSGCCNLRVKLIYLDLKEARVCSKCYQDLICAQLYENSSVELTNEIVALDTTGRRKASGDASVIVVSGRDDKGQHQTSVKHDGLQYKVAPQLASDAQAFETSPAIASSGTISKGNSSLSQEVNTAVQVSVRALQSSIWRDCNGMKFDVALMSELSSPSVVTLLPNLQVSVSIVNLDCCMGRMCWCFVTRGLCAVGQDEVVFVLERLPDEDRVPSDIFFHVCELYDRVTKGNPIGVYDHTLVAEGRPFLGSVNHAGFLYVQPTFQCLHKLPLPPTPYLFGILVHRAEVPWVRVFPIRLLLRLGAEYRYYPCPLVSTRLRGPVFTHVGHTIMNLLVDLRNFQYRLPHIEGLVVHMEDKRTYVNLPRSQYTEIKRAFNSNNDHVLALEAEFCCFGDSHLVCFQNPEGKYITQAINIQNRPRRITGASFIIFNGALKPASGMLAKCSMVEDGLMVQVSPDSMRELKLAVSKAEDYCIECGRLSLPQPEEWVVLKWVDQTDDLKQRSVNKIPSPIDGALLDHSRHRRIRAPTAYFSENFGIQWTDIYYFEDSEAVNCRSAEKCDFEDSVAQACCSTLIRYLERLQLPVLSRVAVRVTTGPNKSDYKIGADSQHSLEVCTDDLNEQLGPLLARRTDAAYAFELILHILEHEP